jgi:uncharacterized membrane protein YjjP (DUF1212 family)
MKKLTLFLLFLTSLIVELLVSYLSRSPEVPANLPFFKQLSVIFSISTIYYFGLGFTMSKLNIKPIYYLLALLPVLFINALGLLVNNSVTTRSELSVALLLSLISFAVGARFHKMQKVEKFCSLLWCSFLAQRSLLLK